MNRTHFVITIVFNVLLTAIMMATPDNKVSIIYAQQLDNNIIEVGSHGIGIDSDGNIFINTLNNAKIQKFTNDGKFIKEWGSEGTGPGQFTLELEHLKADPADRVFITDGAGNPRVQVFDTDGKFLTIPGNYTLTVSARYENSITYSKIIDMIIR